MTIKYRRGGNSCKLALDKLRTSAYYQGAVEALNFLSVGERAAIGDFRDIVMIAGEDAYAYKGIEDVGGAHVRPSGEGGCVKNPGKKKV